MVGDPRHNVESRLMIVETEAAVAFGSGLAAGVLVVAEALPGVPWLPVARAGPAAFDNLCSNSLTRPRNQ